jgi:pyruvate/2-oxoglutarate dehydrogenase complex dihydrolipoamide dehydrogenase (E3) component
MDFQPDAVVIATGSRVAPLDVPGGNQENVYSIYDVIQERATVGNRILVLDHLGHSKGSGIVELLASQGKQVKAVTPLDIFGENLEPSNRVMLYQRILKMDVEMTPHYDVVAIKGNSATLKNVYTEQEIEVHGYDTFVYATQL